MVEKELQAAKDRLPAASRERHKVGRTQKPVPVNGTENLQIAGRKDHAAYGGAFEAGPAGLDLGHRESQYRPIDDLQRRRSQPSHSAQARAIALVLYEG
jgi:hypothetical protein